MAGGAIRQWGRRLRLLATLALACVALSAQAVQIDIPGPPGSGAFGTHVVTLPNGNFVVTDPGWDAPGSIADVGAVYLYAPDGSLISTLTGSNANDRVGSGGITALSNGHYVVRSLNWSGNRGAATWGDGTTGVAGVVSASNSLVGSVPNDSVGNGGITALSNGHYVVRSQNWSGNRGAATWGDGTVGVVGEVSASNSLIGSATGDYVGSSGITALSNGHYVVRSYQWSGNRGAATWGDGTTGVTGEVSASNSLVGSAAYDWVGWGITALSNGHYVVGSQNWSGNRGAATWGNGTTGVVGEVSAGNSLVGSAPYDYVGSSGITALSNGHYVVRSANWSGSRGAATWGDGTTGVVGVVSAGNSLVGSTTNDRVGWSFIALSNGHYVVGSPDWSGNRGAATWGNGTAGVVGEVSVGNSLVGSTANDRVGWGITALSNGHYVVGSYQWSGTRGAATWGNGTTGVAGEVSVGNSLVGNTANDRVGQGITALSNGHYVVRSPNWSGNRGAATWGDGTTGVVGEVSASNSLVGSAPNDWVGIYGITALSNGHYVVRSENWSGTRGAATWGDGTTGVVGEVSASNSLIGSAANDRVGWGITALSNGHYVVQSPGWDNGAITDVGAISLGRGTGGVVGEVGRANSVLGSTAGGGNTLVFAYDLTTPQLIVGRRSDNIVSLRSFLTATSLGSDSNPSTFGEEIVLTATVVGSEPSGSVTFRIAGVDIAGCEDLPLTGTGDSREAVCTTDALPAGTHSLTAHYNGDANNDPSVSAGLSQVVEKPAQDTLTANATPAAIAYGDTSTLSTLGGSGAGAVGYAVTEGSAFCFIDDDTLTGTGVGTCTVTATKAGDADYLPATATTTVTVTQRAITVTAEAKTKVYGEADPALTYTFTPALAGTDTFDGELLRDTGDDVGDYAITQGDLTAGDNYAITFESANFAITPRGVTVTAEAKTKVYGAADPALTYTFTPALVGTDTFDGELSRDTGDDVGDYAITLGDLTAGDNYALSFVGANFAITPRGVTVTADPKTKVYGAADPALTYTFTPALVGTDTFDGELSRDEGDDVGDYAITQGDLTAGGNYALSFVGADFSITPATQTLTFPMQTVPSHPLLPGGTFAIDPLATSASPHSGQPVVHSSLASGVCTVSGTTVTMHAVGSCILAADQAGDGNHDAAAQVTQTVTISAPVTADLHVQLTVDRERALIGDVVGWSIVAANDGPADVPEARLVVAPSVRLGAVLWECVAGACPAPDEGEDSIDATLNLPTGSSVRFDLFGTVLAAPEGENSFVPVPVDASIALPEDSGLSDPEGDNNVHSDSVLVEPVSIFADGFEVPLPET